MQTYKLTLIKSLSQIITQTFKNENIKVKQSKILEIIAHYYQYKDWNSFFALENKKNIREVEVVFFNFFECEEFLRFLFTIEGDFEHGVIHEVTIKKENITKELIELLNQYKALPTLYKKTIMMDIESLNISLNGKDFVIQKNIELKNSVLLSNEELLNIGKYLAKELSVDFDFVLYSIMKFVIKNHYKNNAYKKINGASYYETPQGEKEVSFILKEKEQKFIRYLLGNHVNLLSSLNVSKMEEESDHINFEKINECNLWIDKLNNKDELIETYELNCDHLICLLENIEEELEHYNFIGEYIQKIIKDIQKK